MKIVSLGHSPVLNDQNFLSLLKALSGNSTNIKISIHAKKRMEERAITLKQVVATLQRGFLSESAHRDICGDWIGRISHTAAGQRIEVVASIKRKGNEYILVVTTF